MDTDTHMSWITLLGIAVGLSMDAFAVALAASVVLPKVTPRHIFRFSFHFGLFQAMMPVIGWGIGLSVADYIKAWDHYVAFGLLAYVGSKAIHEALQDRDEEEGNRRDPTRGMRLVVFCLATSIDALAVGLSFAMLGVRVWQPALVIGLVTAVVTTLGMLSGSRLGARFGRRVEVLGGLVLIAIGVKILWEHLV